VLGPDRDGAPAPAGAPGVLRLLAGDPRFGREPVVLAALQFDPGDRDEPSPSREVRRVDGERDPDALGVEDLDLEVVASSRRLAVSTVTSSGFVRRAGQGTALRSEACRMVDPGGGEVKAEIVA